MEFVKKISKYFLSAAFSGQFFQGAFPDSKFWTGVGGIWVPTGGRGGGVLTGYHRRVSMYDCKG